ncbi:hypothetical protein F5Y14DRAFT_466075 [Nemania sp. NC0429]|nr:hypothetical protein F5Y14DRAFT_466075 [Nemania sp. NC0429]
MARSQSRKRHNEDDVAQDKLTQDEHPVKVWLTSRALRELDRRNDMQPPPNPMTPAAVYPENLARFARHGGPNLGHLRGATRRSSAYDDDFEQHLIDHGIYLDGHEYLDDHETPRLENLDQIRQRLLATRVSSSSLRTPDSFFLEFQRKNKTKSEGTVMRKVVPLIAGNDNIPNEGHLSFTNLVSLTSDTTVKPIPDYSDGARVADVHSEVRRDLNNVIIPTKHVDAPVAPNFFLEAKASRGAADVALRQSCYDGAYGARAMHSLQNYGKKHVAYDNSAYTLSSTYHDGVLRLYAHHLTASTTPRGQPQYHMTKIAGFDLTSDQETLLKGVAAFRNARDLAEQHRSCFIKAANSRATEARVSISQNGSADISEIQHGTATQPPSG